MAKSKIEEYRKSGGTFTAGLEGDGNLIEMVKMNDNSLLFVLQNAIYELKFAKQIDPECKNPNIPHNIQQKVLGVGADSQIVGRTFLTASKLFQKKFLAHHIDIDRALIISLEALKEIIVMQETAHEFKVIEETEIAKAERQDQRGGTLVLASITDVKTRCKTFFQKADHVALAMLDLIKLFYPKLKNINFETFLQHVQDECGANDQLVKFLTKALPFLKMVRNARNCLDHRNIDGIEITDFKLLANGTIDLPKIEINFRGTHQTPTILSNFLSNSVVSVVNAFEELIVYLCYKNIKTDITKSWSIGIMAIPEESRSVKSVKYGYCTNIKGEITPIS